MDGSYIIYMKKTVQRKETRKKNEKTLVHTSSVPLVVGQEGRLDNDSGYAVRINVGSRASVFEVTLALLSDVAGNTDGSTAVSNTVVESTDVASFVLASQTLVVVLAIHGNMLHMAQAHLLDGLFNGCDTAFLTHFQSREVGVATSAVPVTLDGLGMDGDSNAKVFSNTFQKVAGSPQVIASFDAFARANLEFELTGGNFSVDTRDLNASVQAGTVMGFNDITAENLASTDTTVVLALRFGIAEFGPAIGLLGLRVDQHVFLLNTKPGVAVCVGIHDFLACSAVIGLVGSAIYAGKRVNSIIPKITLQNLTYQG